MEEIRARMAAIEDPRHQSYVEYTLADILMTIDVLHSWFGTTGEVVSVDEAVQDGDDDSGIAKEVGSRKRMLKVGSIQVISDRWSIYSLEILRWESKLKESSVFSVGRMACFLLRRFCLRTRRRCCSQRNSFQRSEAVPLGVERVEVHVGKAEVAQQVIYLL